jgi:anti-sigma factor RsiW
VAEEHLVTEEPREVAQFLTRELGIQAGPIPRPGLHIEGVEICLIDGRRGALILYRLDGRRVSHYLIPRPLGPARIPAPAHSAPTGGQATIPVVAWASGAVEHALVGEFPAETLLRLARGGNEIAR